MKKIKIKTKKRKEIIDITEKVSNKIQINEGIVSLKSMHTTAGIFVNEGYDEDLKEDFINYFESLPNINFKHMEGNSKAHIFSTFIGNHITIPVENKKMILGRWQKILFFEFDGPRNRKIVIKEIENKN